MWLKNVNLIPFVPELGLVEYCPNVTHAFQQNEQLPPTRRRKLIVIVESLTVAVLIMKPFDRKARPLISDNLPGVCWHKISVPINWHAVKRECA